MERGAENSGAVVSAHSTKVAFVMHGSQNVWMDSSTDLVYCSLLDVPLPWPTFRHAAGEFERACDFIFKIWPMLHDATWTSLMVSLVAGGFSGALSSVVSQPADSVLTYVAQNNVGGNVGVIEGSALMVEQEGVASLFRGLGSRCVWAGSIIAGQFLLYDVFRTYFGVSGVA